MNAKQIIFFLIAGFTLFSCSNEAEDDIDVRNNANGDTEIFATLGTQALPSGLQCNMYIFYKSQSDTDYLFKEVKALNGNDRIKFMNKDLLNKSYRFLFVATSAGAPEVDVTNKSNNPLDTSDKWSDVLITSEEQLISADNYAGVLDKTGDEIMNQGSINGVLTRMVGQIVLDIFRINTSIKEPMDIVSPDVTSVLDRVYKIEVEYTGMTKDVTFGPTNNLVDNNKWTNKLTQTFNITTDSDLKVSVEQNNKNGLEISPVNKSGSARIKGIYCLPSTENIRVKLTFHYYDTTPACGNSDGGVHSTDCYDKRTLVLNLPQDQTDAKLLSVYPNYFTLNKAGIRYDRIIDLELNSSISFETEWSK